MSKRNKQMILFLMFYFLFHSLSRVTTCIVLGFPSCAQIAAKLPAKFPETNSTDTVSFAASPSTRPSIHSANCPSIRSSTHPFVCPYVRPFLRPSVHRSVQPFARSFVRPSVRPSIGPSIHPIVRMPFVHPIVNILFVGVLDRLGILRIMDFSSRPMIMRRS